MAKITYGPWFPRFNGQFFEVNVSENEFAHSIAHVFASAQQQGDASDVADLIASAPGVLAERDRLKAANAELAAALRNMTRAYINLLETGRDRIISLGGTCDSVEVMERCDENLSDARFALEKHNEVKS